jgi:uncharacterized protein with PQ loop repeat
MIPCDLRELMKLQNVLDLVNFGPLGTIVQLIMFRTRDPEEISTISYIAVFTAIMMYVVDIIFVE